MPNSNGTATAEQEHSKTSETETQKKPAIGIVFTPPPVWTGEHWSAFALIRDKNKDKYDEFTRRYLGALHLVKRGWVHITPENEVSQSACDRLIMLATKTEDEQVRAPSGVMGLLIVGIAVPVEASLFDPLSDYWMAL